MHIYGAPGGIWLAYELDLDRGEYVVTNEGGEELFADPWETEARRYCEDLIEREAARLTEEP